MSASNQRETPDVDCNQYLEDLRSEKSLAWVAEQNERTLQELFPSSSSPIENEPLHAELLEVFDDKNRIPTVSVRGDFLYNFWQDEDHVKGIWRRTTWEEYKKKDPEWETVLDIDALAEKEGKSWVYKGARFLCYGPGEYRRADRCLISLSEGGTDACEVREFDAMEKKWVTENPFYIPNSKHTVCWVDRDTLWVGYDYGEGTMSPSGYPLTTRKWSRGTKLEDATEIFRGEATDVSAGGSFYYDKDEKYAMFYRMATFNDIEYYYWFEGDKDLTKVKWIASSCRIQTFKKKVLIMPKEVWSFGGKLYKAGSLLSCDFETFVKEGHLDAVFLGAGARTVGEEPKCDIQILYEPANDRCAYEGATDSRDYLYVSSLENLQSKITVYRFDDATNAFILEGAHEAENCQTFSVGGAEPNSSNALFASSSGFLNPSTYLYSEVGGLKGIKNAQSLKSSSSWFDSEGMSVTLNEATSKDGTKVPYFLVRAKGNDENSGPKPTVLNGYGGFRINSLPSYSGSTGKAFLNHGMNFALACIRGGGEFGPEWSDCAKKENRWKSFEDFNAVAEDLVKIGATTPKQLGCIGGSNGGLLTGAMATHFPESFGAIVSQCPLLDMERYVYLTSGSSWINEYGDPRIENMKPKILAWSPYHQISERSVANMPPTLFTCSTADDRVHPSHARRFVEKAHKVAKDEAKAEETILYHEMTEGGHAGAADNKNRAKIKTIEYTFLRTKLCNAQP